MVSFVSFPSFSLPESSGYGGYGYGYGTSRDPDLTQSGKENSCVSQIQLHSEIVWTNIFLGFGAGVFFVLDL